MSVIHAPRTLPAHPPATPVAPPISLLLVEPQFLIRRTVAAVARELRLAHPKELTTIEQAGALMSFQACDALFFPLDEEAAALELMSRVRNGDTKCRADVSMAVTAAHCSTPLALRLKHLDVRRQLLPPFKVRAALDAIAAPRQGPAENHKPA